MLRVRNSLLLMVGVVISSASIAAQNEVFDQEIATFVRNTSRSMVTNESAIGYRRLRGVHVADSNGCSHVGVIDIGRKRIDNYTVCGESVMERGEVSPAAPDDRDFESMIGNLRRMAILHGRASGEREGYEVKTQMLQPIQDPAGKTACGMVGTIISFDELLVLENTRKVCY